MEQFPKQSRNFLKSHRCIKQGNIFSLQYFRAPNDSFRWIFGQMALITSVSVLLVMKTNSFRFRWVHLSLKTQNNNNNNNNNIPFFCKLNFRLKEPSRSNCISLHKMIWEPIGDNILNILVKCSRWLPLSTLFLCVYLGRGMCVCCKLSFVIL